MGAERSCAGTKRISNLVHSGRWEANLIEDYFWQAGRQHVEKVQAQGQRPLVIWDESVLEKPESLQAEGLCAVRSTKAVRLKRIKPGYFNPPRGRLVIARRKGQSPWYLLTSEPAHSPQLAWQIVLAYARRWQVEIAIRYNKCELAFESLRLFSWRTRQKLLWIAALAYAFMLSLLVPALSPLSSWLLRTFCHRTGKRSRIPPAPLYRLRFALAFLWTLHPPPFLSRL